MPEKKQNHTLPGSILQRDPFRNWNAEQKKDDQVIQNQKDLRNCLELEGLIRSQTALNIYKHNGEVPEIVMTGDTNDIITIASNGWYDWIKLYDPVGNSFIEDKYYLVRYLGPAIDTGPALTAFCCY